jgi:hypothetical protein
MAHPPPDEPTFSVDVSQSSSSIPADHDVAFLQRDELRSFRLGLELLKPEFIQKEKGIRSTIVHFGT